MNRSGLRQKYELYIVSLWFLFLLIIVVTIDIPFCFDQGCHFIGTAELMARNIVSIFALFFATLGILYYKRFRYDISGAKTLPVKLLRLQDINYEHLTFLTTYIIPLICFNLGSPRYVIALGLLLVVIGAIYVRTDKFYMNPTLALLGFQIYLVDLETRTGVRENIVLINLGRLTQGDLVDYQELDNKIYFARRKNAN